MIPPVQGRGADRPLLLDVGDLAVGVDVLITADHAAAIESGESQETDDAHTATLAVGPPTGTSRPGGGRGAVTRYRWGQLCNMRASRGRREWSPVLVRIEAADHERSTSYVTKLRPNTRACQETSHLAIRISGSVDHVVESHRRPQWSARRQVTVSSRGRSHRSRADRSPRPIVGTGFVAGRVERSMQSVAASEGVIVGAGCPGREFARKSARSERARKTSGIGVLAAHVGRPSAPAVGGAHCLGRARQVAVSACALRFLC